MTVAIITASTRLGLRRALLKTVVSHLPVDIPTQTELAGTLGISRARLHALRNGQAEQFSLDALVEFALKLGLTVRMTVTRPYSRDE